MSQKTTMALRPYKLIDFIQCTGVNPIKDGVDPMRVRYILFNSGRFKPRFGEALRSDWFIDLRCLPPKWRKLPDLVVEIFREAYDDAKSGR